DKTVRVWDLVTGRLMRTLRLPFGEGEKGEIHTVAISPDGELVAAARKVVGHQWYETYSIYLFNRRSGSLIRRLSGLPNAVNGLAFSLDGTRLAAVLSGTDNLRVFHMPDGQDLELGRDAYDGFDSFGVAFAADGRLATASRDGR